MTIARRAAHTRGALAALLVGVLAGCGAVATTPVAPAATPAPTVAATPAPISTAITLSEMKVSMATTTFPAGKYTFTITNNGTIQHELLVFRSALSVDKYPTTAAGAIDEENPAITKTSDGDNLNPGQSQPRVIDLTQPGSYVFVCNLPGHFASHMYTVVTVTG